MHGAPAHIDMLAAYLRAQKREEANREFTAQMLWYLNRAVYERIGKQFKHPSWLDLAKPKPKDNRSGYEIKEEVKAKAIALLEKRKGGK